MEAVGAISLRSHRFHSKRRVWSLRKPEVFSSSKAMGFRVKIGFRSRGGMLVDALFAKPLEPGVHEPHFVSRGTVLFEPSHFVFGPLARDIVLGQEFLFGRRVSYASVAFGNAGLNILDPTVGGRRHRWGADLADAFASACTLARR